MEQQRQEFPLHALPLCQWWRALLLPEEVAMFKKTIFYQIFSIINQLKRETLDQIGLKLINQCGNVQLTDHLRNYK